MGARCIEQQALAKRLLNQSGRIDRFIEVDGVHKTDTADLLDLGHAGQAAGAYIRRFPAHAAENHWKACQAVAVAAATAKQLPPNVVPWSPG